MHTEAGLPDLFKNLTLLPKLVQGIKRLYSQERRPRLPITPHILLRFKQHLHLHWHDHQLLWSIMVIAFFGFLHSSELLALCKEDILTLDQTTTPPTFGIHLHSSNTNPFRQSAVIHLLAIGDVTLCPSKAISYLIIPPYLFYP